MKTLTLAIAKSMCNLTQNGTSATEFGEQIVFDINLTKEIIMRKCSDVTGEIKTGIRVAKDFKLKNKTKPQNISKVSILAGKI